jgi:hypothetical protein
MHPSRLLADNEGTPDGFSVDGSAYPTRSSHEVESALETEAAIALARPPQRQPFTILVACDGRAGQCSGSGMVDGAVG